MSFLALALGLAIQASAASPPPAARYTEQVQRSLEAARAQLHVLQSEVSKAGPGTQSEGAIEKSARSVSSNITQAIAGHEKLHRVTDSELQARENPDYRGLSQAISQLSISNHNLETRIGDRLFLKDRKTALDDLSRIDQDLVEGISHAKALSHEMAWTKGKDQG